MTDNFPITIYHNPRCGTSRNVLAMIEAAGYQPTVIDYLKTGWTQAQLRSLLDRIGAPAQAILRDKESLVDDLGLRHGEPSDEALLEAMVAHPILVNRPIVLTPKGAALCRPSERVLDLLERVPQSFVKEDGQIVQSPIITEKK